MKEDPGRRRNFVKVKAGKAGAASISNPMLYFGGKTYTIQGFYLHKNRGIVHQRKIKTTKLFTKCVAAKYC